MSAQVTERRVRRTRRRAVAFSGLLLGCAALVEAKAATAPATHRIVVGSPSAPVAGAPNSGRTSAGTSKHPRSTNGAGASTAPTASTATRAVTGQPIDIGYGIVQVRLTLQGGRITDVSTLQTPSGGRSGSIASYAVPQLRTEVLAAQSTNIDTVSGASYTSDGYARSVQSALDAAHA
ncbi:MAG TPA: FMN-binding protein [Frankiaceae bacterium]|nr:FMN-binding protein [Frankiaceae bacterium]